MKYAILLLFICSCSFDRDLYYSYDNKEYTGYHFTPEYDLNFKHRSLFIQSTNKKEQYGYSLHHATIFAQWKFPF